MIKRLIACLILITSSATQAKLPTAPVYISNGYVTGNAYREWPNNIKQGYVMGVVDGFLLSPFLGADSNDIKPVSECITGVRSDQLRAIVDAHLNRRPELWDHPMHSQVYGALFDACKARGKPLR